MRPIFILVLKDLRRFRRDRGQLVLTLLVPFVLMVVFGAVFGVNRARQGPSAVPVALLNLDPGTRAAGIASALKADPAFRVIGSDEDGRNWTEAGLEQAIRAGRYRFGVVLRPGPAEEPARVRILSAALNPIEAQTVESLIERDSFVAAMGPKALLSGAWVERREISGESGQGNPMASQVIGGWAMQFLLFALAVSAQSLFDERDRGVFQRILSGPVTRGQILASKFLYGILLGALQLAVLFAAGGALFHVRILPYAPQLALVCVAAGAACSGLGMLLAGLAGSLESSRGMTTLAVLLLSALGGAWFPVSFMPETMQRLSRLSPVYWAIDGFGKALWMHASVAGLLSNVGVLLAMAAAFLAVAWHRFERGRILG